MSGLDYSVLKDMSFADGIAWLDANDDPEWRERARARSEARIAELDAAATAQSSASKEKLAAAGDDLRAAMLSRDMTCGTLRAAWLYGDTQAAKRCAGHTQVLVDEYRHYQKLSQARSWQDLRSELRDGGHTSEVMAPLRTCSLWVLTGVGESQAEAWFAGELLAVAQARVDADLPTVVVSPLAPDAWEKQAAAKLDPTSVRALKAALMHGSQGCRVMEFNEEVQYV